jgi:hypothetical protein
MMRDPFTIVQEGFPGILECFEKLADVVFGDWLITIRKEIMFIDVNKNTVRSDLYRRFDL